jgi:3-oxoacyl-(acyl-carrier-protein) synthase
MKAFSITLANGDVSGLDALGLAMRLLQQGRARAAVVVSSASLCNEIVLSASRAGWLAEAQNVRVFDRDTRGAAVGEAAAALVLETLARTAERGGKPKAILGGQASRFAPRREFVSAALSRACRRALELADSTPADIALISSAGNGVPDTDRVEALALLDVLGGEKPPVVAIKATLGETAECSGLLQTIGAISALSTRTAWPIPRLRTPAVPGLNYAMDAIPISGSQALVTSTSLTGACSALLLSLPNA